VREDRRLPNGRIVDAGETNKLFAAVDTSGLRGGGLWYDAAMPNSQRLQMEILRWACRCGATCLNYVEASDLIVDAGKVTGIKTVDRESGRGFEYRAPIVVNCGGPWCRRIARQWDQDIPRLFQPSLAFNVFLNREPPSDVALAVTPRRPGGQTLFLHPWQGRILAGTHHVPWEAGEDNPRPAEADLRTFLDNLNEAVPGFDLGLNDMLRVHAGLLPAAAPNTATLAVREVLYEHGAQGGPSGLFSVSGVKYTTARLVAEKTLRMIYQVKGRSLGSPSSIDRPEPNDVVGADEFRRLIEKDRPTAQAYVQRFVYEEAVFHLDDLFFRRTDWAVGEPPAEGFTRQVADLIGWDAERIDWEMVRVKETGP
jgi:glycerol-3-phosphate dehydrogenase